MAKPKGSINKPKVCMIKLSALNETLQSTASIPVDINFAKALFANHIEYDDLLKTFDVDIETKETDDLELNHADVKVVEFN
jgi:NACalpha-BTF3-like transcription factor